MAVRKKPKNDFGVELMAFCATYGLTYRDVATGADVKRSTLIECTTGRCAGHELIPKVRQFMADYEAQKASSEREERTHDEKHHSEISFRGGRHANPRHLTVEGLPDYAEDKP